MRQPRLKQPDRAVDILFGASCCLAIDNEFARTLLDAWDQGRSSLREPLSRAA